MANKCLKNCKDFFRKLSEISKICIKTIRLILVDHNLIQKKTHYTPNFIYCKIILIYINIELALGKNIKLEQYIV